VISDSVLGVCMDAGGGIRLTRRVRRSGYADDGVKIVRG